MSPESTHPAVEIREVFRRYGGIPALNGVSLSIGEGDTVAFFGHNGAGKTTLLRLIAMHIRPSSGNIALFGQDIATCGWQMKQRIGLLSHENFLYAELSIRENLHFYARLFGIDGEEHYRDLVDHFGLRRWYLTPAGRLSFGLKKRADLVRALLHHPDIILLDEPFAGLDAQTCGLLIDHFQSQRGEGRTLLISSHSREWTEKLCNREVVFDKGKIVEDSLRRGKH